jgi:purine-nucleoside phosphorylase
LEDEVMMQTPTPHIGAKLGEIAKTVLMPGDPLRAKFIAENFLEDVVQFNLVRNMLGYTGTYKGKRISVMGGGMGMPSIGIYSYELFNFYDVDNIIRIGTAGSLNVNVKLRDVVIALGASTNSNYASQYCLPGTFAPIASYDLVRAAVEASKENNIKAVVGNILSSDTFYCADKTALDKWRRMGILAVEMEAAALYMNAAEAGKNALCLLTISDCILTGESLSAEDRQVSFTDMMEIALKIAK